MWRGDDSYATESDSVMADPPKPRKRRSASEARRVLIGVAREVLARGDGELEMLQVAERAGVSEGLAYYHFGNKAGLLAAVVRDFYERLDDAVMAVPFPGETWIDRERARTAEFVRLMYEDPIAPLVLNVLRVDPALYAEERERQRRLHALGARNIANAQRAGEIANSHDPKLLVAMILGGIMAGVTEALSDVPSKPIEQTHAAAWEFVLRAAGLQASTNGDRPRTNEEAR